MTTPSLAEYRQDEWNPTFDYQPNYGAAADHINSFHPDDYPRYVKNTELALFRRLNQRWPGSGWPEAADLLQLHREIFQGDKPSEWRKVNVTVGGRLRETYIPRGNWRTDPADFYIMRQVVGGHRPPGHEQVPELMEQFLKHYRLQPVNRETVTAWYQDFETIHPFVDGNGRVGGCVVALLSHHLRFKMRQFLVPNA